MSSNSEILDKGFPRTISGPTHPKNKYFLQIQNCHIIIKDSTSLLTLDCRIASGFVFFGSLDTLTFIFNRLAVDWGADGFLAYGSLDNIVLVDPFSCQVFNCILCSCAPRPSHALFLHLILIISHFAHCSTKQ